MSDIQDEQSSPAFDPSKGRVERPPTPLPPRADVGRPWPEEFSERRGFDTLKGDGRSVRAQVGGLARGGATEAWRETTTRVLVAQRAKDPSLPQIALLRDRRGDTVPFTQGELLVRADITGNTELWALLQTYGKAEAVEKLDGRVLRVRTALPPQRLDELARFVRQSGYEASVNHITPLGPLMKGEGGPEQTTAVVEFPSALATADGHSRVTVVVIDTGICAEPRTDGWGVGLRAADGSNADPLDALPADGLLDLGAGHGTFAAGVVQQIAPMAQLMVLRAMRSDGIGDEVDVAMKIVEALRSADREAPLVINLSLGAETLDDQPLLAIEVALEIAHEVHPDVLVVAAAGNSGWKRPCFPAASRDVVAVAALGADLYPTEWTNRGFWVDCAVVGQGVLSTFVPGHESELEDKEPEVWGENPWALWSGTSFAAPQVAAAVARRIAEAGGTTHEALAWLFSQAPKIPDVGHVLQLLPGTPLA